MAWLVFNKKSIGIKGDEKAAIPGRFVPLCLITTHGNQDYSAKGELKGDWTGNWQPTTKLVQHGTFLNHFENIEPVFCEASRILKDKGIFGFIVADRKNDEKSMFEVQHAGSCHKMYRHSLEQILEYTEKTGFRILPSPKLRQSRQARNDISGETSSLQCSLFV